MKLRTNSYKTPKVKIKAGQIWQDKKTGDLMRIGSKHHDRHWNCLYDRSPRINHKNNEFVIYKYYKLVK